MAWHTDGILSPCWVEVGESRAPVPQDEAAVVVIGHIHPILLEKLAHDLIPQPAQVTGDDQVVIGRGPACVLEMGAEGVISGGGKCSIRPIKSACLGGGTRFVQKIQ